MLHYSLENYQKVKNKLEFIATVNIELLIGGIFLLSTPILFKNIHEKMSIVPGDVKQRNLFKMDLIRK